MNNMKKSILTLGIIALFVGMVFVSIGSSVETKTKGISDSFWLDAGYNLCLEDVTFRYVYHSLPRLKINDGEEYYEYYYVFMTVKGMISGDSSYISNTRDCEDRIDFNNGDNIELFIGRGNDNVNEEKANSKGHHDSLHLGGSGIFVFLIK